MGDDSPYFIAQDYPGGGAIYDESLGVGLGDMGVNALNPPPFDERGPLASPIRPPLEAALTGQYQQQSGPSRQEIYGEGMPAFDNLKASSEAQGKQEMMAGGMEALDIRRKPSGDLDVKNISPELWQMLQESVQFRQQALAGYASELARIQEQERRRSPILNALTQVAGQLAQDPRVNPVVGALGRASMALNPTEQQLRAQRMAILERQAEMADTGITAHLRVVEGQERVAAAKERAATANVGLSEKLEKERYDNVEEAARQLMSTAKADGTYDEAAFKARLEAADAKPSEIAKILPMVKVAAEGEGKRRAEDVANQKRGRELQEAQMAQSKEIAALSRQTALAVAAASQGGVDARKLAGELATKANEVREKNFMPPPVKEDVDALTKAYQKLDATEKAMGRLANATGRFQGKITEWDWSKSPIQKEAMTKIHASLIDSMQADAERLGRATEKDASFFLSRSLSLTDPVETTLAQIKELKGAIKRGFERKLAQNPLVDWGGMYYDVFPAELRPKVRQKYPQGKNPVELYAPNLYDKTVVDIVKGAQNSVTAARTELGTPRLQAPTATPAAPATQPAGMDPEFLSFLKTLPAGKGAKDASGKTWAWIDGRPVEVK